MLNTVLDIKKDAERNKHGFHFRGAHGYGGGTDGYKEKGRSEVLECGCRVLWGSAGGGDIWIGSRELVEEDTRGAGPQWMGRGLSRQR